MPGLRWLMPAVHALVLMPAVCAASAAAIPYKAFSGYISQGADLINGTMSIAKAKEICTGLADCLGFTFAAEYRKVLTAMQLEGPNAVRAQVWLKGTDEWVAHNEHVTFLKQLSKCDGVRFMRFKLKTHGPYCCEGDACPRPGDFGGESRCLLPAATLYNLPHCSQLRGAPLRNLAPQGTASASSEYPFAENSGPAAGNDGVANASIFHSACGDGPHWWRVDWEQPVALTQLVLHNRKDFRGRMVTANLRVVSEDESFQSVTIRVARGMYIWTVRPTARRVKRVEILLAKDCLHFSELEAFGVTEEAMKSADNQFTEVPTPDASKTGGRLEGGADAPDSPAASAAGATSSGGSGPGAPQRDSGRRAAAAGDGDGKSGAASRSARAPTAANQEPSLRAGMGLASSGAAPQRAHGGAAAGAFDEAMEDSEYEAMLDRVWMVVNFTTTLAIMVTVQYLWLKHRFLKYWE